MVPMPKFSPVAALTRFAATAVIKNRTWLMAS
jgi:hypothetical protein